jgi:hypothetical protein
MLIYSDVRTPVRHCSRLRRSLLPKATPAAPGLKIASRYRPGVADAGVGGDWYDVIGLPDDRTGLVIGDVMGRGVRAAAVMGRLQAALRVCALDGSRPADVLRRLDLVLQAVDDTRLTTCVYGVFELRTARLTVAAAGHPPPLLAASCSPASTSSSSATPRLSGTRCRPRTRDMAKHRDIRRRPVREAGVGACLFVAVLGVECQGQRVGVVVTGLLGVAGGVAVFAESVVRACLAPLVAGLRGLGRSGLDASR